MRDYFRKYSAQPVLGTADTNPVTRVFIFSNCIRVRQKILSLFYTDDGSLELTALPALGASARIKSKIWLKKVGNLLPMRNFSIRANCEYQIRHVWTCCRILPGFKTFLQLNTSCRYSYTAKFKRNQKKEEKL